MAEPISAAEVRTGVAYEDVRRRSRDRLAAAQADRRIQLVEDLALVFDGRDAVVASLEEALRAERATASEAVEAAAEAFGALLAPPGALAATLYIDVTDPAALTDRVAALAGVGGAVFLDVAGARVAAQPAWEQDLGTGAIHLVFALDEDQCRSWRGAGSVAVVVDHPAAHARVELSWATRSATGSDLLTA